MDLATQYQVLGRKQLKIQEAIDFLRSIRLELYRTRVDADFWGKVAVMANVTLIPLNAIVNAFELKAANSAYQLLVRELYSLSAKSGTRLDGRSKVLLASLKLAIVAELKRKALTDLVPGVNIIVGFAEDSLAAWQAVQLVESGRREMAAQAARIDRQIAAAVNQLNKIGMLRAEMISRAQLRARTA